VSRTKEWLMDQPEHDLGLLAAENANLRDLVRQMLAACEGVMADLNDEQSDAWVQPTVRWTLRAAMDRAKGAAE
jgi:hypothetical protein